MTKKLLNLIIIVFILCIFNDLNLSVVNAANNDNLVGKWLWEFNSPLLEDKSSNWATCEEAYIDITSVNDDIVNFEYLHQIGGGGHMYYYDPVGGIRVGNTITGYTKGEKSGSYVGGGDFKITLTIHDDCIYLESYNLSKDGLAFAGTFYRNNSLSKEEICKYYWSNYQNRFRFNNNGTVSIWYDDGSYSESDTWEIKNNNLIFYSDCDNNQYCLVTKDENGTYLDNGNKVLYNYEDKYDCLYNTYEETNPISVVLNDKKLTFDQPPIIENGRILLPIRKIAEEMGKTVLWSEASQTAFIDNTDFALIIPIGKSKMYLGDETGCDEWPTVSLDVPSQIKNERTLVPLRAFCESLGADVKWDDKTHTAYITCNTSTEKMSDALFDDINFNYYIMNFKSNPFESYNEIVEDFYDNRNQKTDAVAMGVSNLWSGVEDLLSMSYGSDNATNIMTQTLYDILSEMSNDDIYCVDLDILETVKDYASNGIQIYSEAGGLSQSITKSNKALEKLNKSIMGLDKNQCEKIGDIFDYAIIGIDEVTYLLSDYSNNYTHLENLKNALNDIGCSDDKLNKSISLLETKYTDAFTQTLMDMSDKIVVEKLTSDGISALTGGCFGLGKFVWDQVFKLTTVTAKGEALKSFYGIYCYNWELDKSLVDCICASRTNPDLTKLKSLWRINIAAKKILFRDMRDITNHKDSKQYANEVIQELDDYSYYTWIR